MFCFSIQTINARRTSLCDVSRAMARCSRNVCQSSCSGELRVLGNAQYAYPQQFRIHVARFRVRDLLSAVGSDFLRNGLMDGYDFHVGARMTKTNKKITAYYFDPCVDSI